MRKDLLTLPLLTPTQALVVLKDLLGYDLSYEDLISQCEHGQCEMFVLLGEVQGTSCTALPIGNDDWTNSCYAAGLQKVLNPRVFTSSRNEVKLVLLGAVHADCDSEALKYQQIEWSTLVALSECDVRFQTIEIQDFAKRIASSMKPIDPREKRSLYQIIAVLASMSGINISTPYAVYSAMVEQAAVEGIVFDMNDDTLAKHLNAAAAQAASPNKS